MNTEQIAQELRDTSNRLDRLEASIDQNITELRTVVERVLPGATASISHTLSGTQKILADLAGTLQSLAAQVYDMNDRLTVLERVIDSEMPPNLNPL